MVSVNSEQSVVLKMTSLLIVIFNESSGIRERLLVALPLVFIIVFNWRLMHTMAHAFEKSTAGDEYCV